MTAAQGTLFKPAFLGDQWPAIDFYVELLGIPASRPHLLVQVKSTSRTVGRRAKNLAVSIGKRDVARLMELPSPT